MSNPEIKRSAQIIGELAADSAWVFYRKIYDQIRDAETARAVTAGFAQGLADAIMRLHDD